MQVNKDENNRKKIMYRKYALHDAQDVAQPKIRLYEVHKNTAVP